MVAMMRPELIRKLVILNVSHPIGFSRWMKRSTKQKLKLIYQLFFQPPLLPELLMPYALPLMMRKAGRFTREEIGEYKKMWRDFPTRRAMANYYRAMRRHRAELRDHMKPIDTPVLLIWAEHEPVFMRQSTELFDDYVPNLRIAHIAGAGHFVHADQPEIVSELLIEFARD